MPHYLSIGVPKYDFFHSTPRILEAYDKAFEQQEKRKDYELWTQGAYIYKALDVIMYNNFGRSKSQLPEEYLSEPFHVSDRMRKINAGEIEMTEEEKEYWRQKIFGNLQNMQQQFEATHGKK